MAEQIDNSDLITQHRQRFKLNFPSMSITLKHLTRLEMQRVYERLIREVAGYGDLMKSAAYFCEISEQPDGIPPEMLPDFLRVMKALEPYNEAYWVPCFADPKCNTIEDVDVIATALPPEEWKKVQDLLIILTQPIPPKESNIQFLIACRRANIPIANDLTAENATLAQADAMIKAGKRDIEEIRAAMKGAQ
jgi:hypothetical protein